MSIESGHYNYSSNAEEDSFCSARRTKDPIGGGDFNAQVSLLIPIQRNSDVLLNRTHNRGRLIQLDGSLQEKKVMSFVKIPGE